MARRGRGQFQFTVTELGVLAASFAVTSILVFFLGLYVGRDLAAHHEGPDERVARIPISENPPAQPSPMAAGEKEGAPADVDEETAAGAGRPAAEGSAAIATSRPAPEPAAPAPKPVPSRATPQAEGRSPSSLPAGILPAREPAPTAAVEPSRASSPQPYTVQVLATRNRKEAEALAADLKRQGYGAFLTPVEDTGGKWYRVRIGRYDDPQAARSMADRCKRELGLSQAYVSPF